MFVVNAVMGVEVNTERLWQRAEELGLSRLIFVNMLDRERADFFRTLDSLKEAFGPHVVATEIPIGSEHEVRGVIDLIDMKAYEYDGRRPRQLQGDPDPGRPPGAGRRVPREADGRGRRGLRRADGALPRGRGDLPRGDGRARSSRASPTARCSRSPAAWRPRTSAPTGCSTRSWRTCPRPARRAPCRAQGDEEISSSRARTGDLVAFVFKTLADPFAGRINLFRVYQGVLKHDSHLFNCRDALQGAHRPAARVRRARTRARRRVRARATSARVAKLKETHAGDVLSSKDRESSCRTLDAAARR